MINFSRSKKVILKLGVVAIASLCTSIASAHHSFALFDISKLITVTGTVKEWSWSNPHTWLKVIVVKADGSSEEWALVGSSPNMMSRWGWNAADINVGDKVVVDVHPTRDGQHNGSLQTIFLPKGKVLMDPGGQSGEALAAGPSAVPTKPQGEAYK
jgi:hypothetical protein